MDHIPAYTLIYVRTILGHLNFAFFWCRLKLGTQIQQYFLTFCFDYILKSHFILRTVDQLIYFKINRLIT